MAAGGGRRWQDDLKPDARLLVRQRMVKKLVGMFKANRHVNLEDLHSFAANVEEGAFITGQNEGDYLRRIAINMRSVEQNQKRALQASAENTMQQMQIAQQMQLGNPVQAAQGGSALLARTPQAASVMTCPARPPFQQPHMAGPNMQIRPSNMMAVVNQNFNPQFATFAPMAPGVQSGQQIAQSIPMQSQNIRQAMQLQHPSFASYNPASVAQPQGQPVVRPNAQPNHLLNRNASGIYSVQQQPMQFMRNRQSLGVNQHHTNSRWNQMVGANNVVNLNIGYLGGLNKQNVGSNAGLHSSLKACEQEVFKTQINMESQLITPACGQVTVNQQGNVYCPSLQTPEMTSPDQAVDWREKMFQQIQSWKAAYFSELMELNRIFVIPKITEEQLQSLPKHKAEAYKRNSHVKDMITGVLNFLHLQKSEIPETYKEKLPMYETAIHKLLDYHKKTKAHIKGRNVVKESQDPHGKPQTIDLTGDTDPFNDGQSRCGQQNQSKEPADASISQMRQNIITETPPAHQKTDSSDPQGVRSPCFSVKSPGGLWSSPNNDVGLCCTTSPVAKSGVVEVASPYGSLNSTSQSPIAKPGVVLADLPCASVKSSLTSTVDKSRILSAASSPCSSVESTLLSTVANSAVLPVDSPCNLVKSTASDDINNRHRVTPSELTVPASPAPRQTTASQTEDVVCDRANTPVAKKPMDRLIDAVLSLSPTVLHSSVDSMKSALVEMDSVPLPPWSRSNNKMKRAYSESPPPDSLDMSGAAYNGERAAKRQKAQNAKGVLLDEIEAINSKLIDTTISVFGGNPADGITSCDNRTLIKLLHTRVSLAPSLKWLPLVTPVTLLVPTDYPASSPTLICDEGDEQLRKNSISISEEVDAAFRRALRVLPEPRSLKDIASTWDACVRRAITDFVQQHAGGALGPSLGWWESCIGA